MRISDWSADVCSSDLGTDASVEEPGRWAVRAAVHARLDGPTDHLPVHQGRPDHPADHLPQATQQRTQRDRPGPQGRGSLRRAVPLKETRTVANYSRWEDGKKKRPAPHPHPPPGVAHAPPPAPGSAP